MRLGGTVLNDHPESLDDFSRVHAQDMHADDLVRRPVDEHLQPPLYVAMPYSSYRFLRRYNASELDAHRTKHFCKGRPVRVQLYARKSAAIESDRCAGRTFM